MASDVPSGVAGLWFAILRSPTTDARLAWKGIAVRGCSVFSADDPGAAWTKQVLWSPPDAEMRLPGLAAMPTRSYSEHLEVLFYAASLIHRLRPQTDAIAGVAVGFDDGEFITIWPTVPENVRTFEHYL